MQTSAMKTCFQIAECRFNFCKGRKNLGIMQVHFGSFVCFPYFLCYNTALCSWKTAIKRGRNCMEGFLHPYKRVNTSLWKCLYILMQSSFNVFECPFRGFECPFRAFERRFRAFERRNDKDAETNSLCANNLRLWYER